ncbi:MAG: type II secretion system minor pseudopilin GspK [Proteobacteria bacterium]|nr:type II secretion system minor pseudopilin GspK [Pseudomonadota bacterium]
MIRRTLRSEGGFVLIVTLMVTALLVAVIVEFAYRSYLSTARADNFSGSARAALLAANGVEVASSAMREMLKKTPHIRMADGGLDFSRTEGDYTINIRVEDELARLSTEVVYTKTGVVVEPAWSTYVRLVEALELDTNIVETLADWIDADSEPRSYGAESLDHYSALPRPYKSADAPLASVEELMMVKGYTPEVFRLLKPYVTVYNSKRRVNINTAPRAVLKSLSEEMTEEMVESIIEYRMAEPFRRTSDIMGVPGFETVGIELQDRVAVKSDLFRVISRATAGEAVREVEAVVRAGGDILYWRHR